MKLQRDCYYCFLLMIGLLGYMLKSGAMIMIRFVNIQVIGTFRYSTEIFVAFQEGCNMPKKLKPVRTTGE